MSLFPSRPECSGIRSKHGDLKNELERMGTIDGSGGRDLELTLVPVGKLMEGLLATFSARGPVGPKASAARPTRWRAGFNEQHTEIH